MDAIAMFGALAASEGSNAMAILTPVELPPGHVSWTTKDITVADQAFASKDQIPLLQTVLATGACVVAWKEATFMDKTQDDEDEEKSIQEAPQRGVNANDHDCIAMFGQPVRG